ncbi:ABC transporter ATP-binding protein [Micrococcus sp. EYE_162]|uniref:ABC transporter ATP-binding protein n=1 Tax=unclassified Micrococcus TaxID=2620948 RepID=UPI00200414F4|nr:MULTISPECIES: ABC transporter ATP-binding protein [unclassified Micrococcus]MCK6095426.1 ABC transporter ATP-binding protein [Micrococcus sp. EYE_212]MCK6171501.1 ABC transporter ATP-binding protein [Micrococcus sp. EYE_162]
MPAHTLSPADRSLLAADRPPAAATPAPTARRDSLGVTFHRVGRTFSTADGPRVVLRDVDLTVAPGEVLAILGASGCGKSTLLRAIGGLDMGFDGLVAIDGDPVRPYDERTAVGFQEPRLMPWRTIRQNVEMGLPRTLDRAEGQARVDDLLALVGLAPFAHHRPREVSGGMAQRASLARALTRRPGVLLLDEPFGALDALTRLKMQDLLLDVHAATGTTVILVTHDVEEALHLADRVLLLADPTRADGERPPAPGATVSQIVTVPGARPHDRSNPELVRLRTRLLAGLGVATPSL